VLPGYTCGAVMFDFMKIVMYFAVHKYTLLFVAIFTPTFSLIIRHVYAFGRKLNMS